MIKLKYSAVGSGWAMLCVGLALLAISNGRWSMPSAIWIGMPLAVAGLRRLPVRTALALGAPGFIVVFVIQSQGVINLPPPASLVIGAGFGLVGFIAYAADRLAAPRLGPALGTLVFPLTLCTVEFVTGRVSPYGTFGSIAYSQAGFLPLLQLLSLTGLWGVTFLIGWFASTAVGVWEARADPRRLGRVAVPFGLVAAAVLIFGEARLALTPASPTVRVAATSPTTSDGFHFIDLAGDACLAGRCDGARKRAAEVQDELIAGTRREAVAGARAILWSEDSGTVFKADEAAFIDRARQLAKAQGVTLVMALQVLTPGRPLAENKAVVLGPSGDVSAVYEKTRPVPGDPDQAGDGRIPVVATPVGRLATAICFDLDFPPLMRQVGRGRADLLFAPASDWREIAPLHAQMAVFRAIENGASLLRATRRGVFLATDPLGRELGALDFFTTASRTLVVNVPVRGTATLYPWLGDLCAWLGFLASVLLIVLAWTRRARGSDRGRSSVDQGRRGGGDL